MNFSLIAILLTISSNGISVAAFRSSPDGNPEVMKKAIEDAVLTKIKPLQDTPLDRKAIAPPIHNRILGTVEECQVDYWCRSDIHTLGNVGFGGAVHAAMAPLATKMIDMKAYGGKDVRAMISQELRHHVQKAGARVADLCCGVGISTRALGNAFHDAEFVVGLDTSPEMISMAQAITSHDTGVERVLTRHLDAISNFLKQDFFSLWKLGAWNPGSLCSKCQLAYRLGNAEETNLPSHSFDLVTIMYGFHEIPMEGRGRIISEARRLLRRGGHLAILDICPTYQPSEYMLAGEPFVKEYQKNIDDQVKTFPGYKSARKVVVPGHVNLWLLTKNGEQ